MRGLGKILKSLDVHAKSEEDVYIRSAAGAAGISSSFVDHRWAFPTIVAENIILLQELSSIFS